MNLESPRLIVPIRTCRNPPAPLRTSCIRLLIPTTIPRCWCCWWWLKVSTLTGPLAPMPRSPELIFLINSWDGWICTEAMSSVPGCNSWLMNSNALRDR